MCLRLLFYILTAVSLVACGSGGRDFVNVPVDDGAPLNDPVQGSFDGAGDGFRLSFTLAEDTTIDGLFQLDSQTRVDPVTILSLPEHGFLTLLAQGQAFRYAPEPDYSGTDGFDFITQDGDEVTVQLDITSVDDPPVLFVEFPEIADQGRQFSVNLIATDVDSDRLVFSANGLPAWMMLDSQSGLLSGIPSQDDIGIVRGMRFIVSDDTGLTDEIADVSLEVVDINDAPFLNLSQAPQTLLARESVSFSTFPDDPDSDAIEVSVEPNPIISATVQGSVVTLVATDVESVTAVSLAIRARDEFGALSREILEIMVLPTTESGNGITVLGHQSGPGVHLVILGDGYTADQQARFDEHVESVIEKLGSDPGIANHLGAFNVHKVRTVSRNSGADDRYSEDIRDTAFDSGYNCRSIPRLICADNLKVLEAALQEYPGVDQLILLVNDLRYGGSGNSGGSIAITSAFSPEIAVHEMGHSLADLADEYVDPLLLESTGTASFEEGDFANVSLSSDPQQVPWSHWIDFGQPLQQSFGDDGVGVFEGGLYRPSGVYRPTFTSRMRDFEEPFGPINSEQWVLRLYTLTDGVRDFSPRDRQLQLTAGEPQVFSVTPIFGLDNQSVVWELDGEVIQPEEQPDRLELALSMGNYELVMTVSDISGAIRLPPPHAGIFSRSWSIQVR
jgi:hypothetical protein